MTIENELVNITIENFSNENTELKNQLNDKDRKIKELTNFLKDYQMNSKVINKNSIG